MIEVVLGAGFDGVDIMLLRQRETHVDQLAAIGRKFEKLPQIPAKLDTT
jgi:hypothetical protein